MESVVSISAPVETLTCSEHISRSAKDGTSSDSDDAEMECENPFSCEICDSGNNSSAVFKERRHLDAHILKDHPTACIGCYDVFESKERLLKHLEVEKHEKPSFCHQCRGVFLDDADMENHDFGCKSSAIEEGQVSVKEECVSSDDDEEDTEVSCVNAFLCEICDSADNESHAVFKERSDLVLHTFKNHPYSCIGCFESFHSLKDLKKHAMEESHRLPFCLECCTLFPDYNRLGFHHCEQASISEAEGEAVKMEPPSEDEGSVYASSSEEDSNDESEAEDRLEKIDLSCIHCTIGGFLNQHDLRVHTCKKPPSVCVVCFEGFDDEAGLRNHQKALHHTVWKCARCDMYFIRRMFYRTHVTANHPEDCPYRCPDCDLRTFSPSFLRYHRRKEHGGLQWNLKLGWEIYRGTCHICLKTFMTGYSLLLHLFREHNQPGQTHVYKCEVCQLGFGRGTAFEIHLKEDHPDDTEYLNEAKTLLESTLRKSQECDVCGYSSRNHRTLHKHISTKHPELRPHKCNICDARYPEESDVRVHMSCDHEGPAGISCPICEYTGREASFLERHLRSRHGYEGMPYMYCFTHQKRIINYAKYRSHFELHHMDPADRPVRPKPKTGFPCHLCEREFGQACFLKYHIARVHSYSGKRLKCDQCGITFKDIYGLTSHKVKHTDTFKCKICNKTFEMQYHLDRHQVVHSGEKPFQCELCGLRMSQKSSLQRHLKVVHADDKSSKSFKPQRSRGPKLESGVKEKKIHEEKAKEVNKLSSEEQRKQGGDNVKENSTRSRKRRKESKSPSGALPKTKIHPKRKRVQPEKGMTEEEAQHFNDDVKTAVHRRRGRPRKAKAGAEKQLHLQSLQTTSDDVSVVGDDEELPSYDSGSEDE